MAMSMTTTMYVCMYECVNGWMDGCMHAWVIALERTAWLR